jgi:uncharacterized oligopeptide transporter (OPT) family protein
MSESATLGTPTSPPEYPRPDLTVPQFTLRAILTGMVLGAVLSLCNIYAGLKVGWGFNMSITAALLSYAFWDVARRLFGRRTWNLLENNINQTTASAGANIASAGFVSAIPALTIMTGFTLPYGTLALWVFAVCLVGIVVAVALRRQMLHVDKLPFPSGIATAETLKEMYAHGREALMRAGMLLTAGALSAGLKVVVELAKLPKLGLPFKLPGGGALEAKGIGFISFKNLGFALDPSLLLVGVGAIAGIRTGASMMGGALVAWLLIGPEILARGWVSPGRPDAVWFGPVVEWLLWPGVAMMVSASLTSFAFSWRSVVAALRPRTGPADESTSDHEVPRQWLIGAIIFALSLAVTLQAWLFGIGWGIATLGGLMTFVLAIVAGRVTGETGITPVGAMGKVTQLTFGLLSPGNVTANLMAANVTGGAASQTGDLLHDLKTGLLIGASPRFQAFAQVLGAIAGSLAGTAAYLIMVPNPGKMLLTEEWPAPAVLQWKAVAEVFKTGIDKMPTGALTAALVAAVIGILLAAAEKLVPKRIGRLLPSAAAIGLSFTLPAFSAISIFLGALIGALLTAGCRSWSSRFLIVIAAGLIAGESLAGVGLAVRHLIADQFGAG